MPRAIDPSMPGGGLPLTHNPLNTIQHNVIPNPWDLAELLEAILEALLDQIRDYWFPAIEQLTGIDLSVFLPLLDVLDFDFSSPAAFLESVVAAIVALPAALTLVTIGIINELTGPEGEENLTLLIQRIIELLILLPELLTMLGNGLINSAAGLLGGNSPLNALNLFGIAPPHVLGQLDVSHIGTNLTNLLTDPDFLDDSPIIGWLHNLTGGFGGTGTRYTTANGTLKELFGNLIPVSEGQVVPISGKAKWTSLVGTGSPIALAITGYLNGSAVVQSTIASHSTVPATTDWLTLSGSYTVPAGVDAIRIRLVVDPAATAGTVYFSKTAVTKTEALLQRLIRGTNVGELLPDDISHLFTGIVTNALELLEKVGLVDFNQLVSTIGGDFGDDLAAAEARLADFLHTLSPLNGSNIASGSVADDFVPGIGTTVNNIVTGLQGITGAFNHTDSLSALMANAHALVDHGAGISNMYARMSNLESQFAALPISAGGTGSGNADGGVVGVIDTDLFERTSSSSLGALWSQSQSGTGVWATPNGHDATWVPTSSIATNTEFLCIRANPDILRSATDYQRVTMELSSKASRIYDQIFGTYNNAGANDIWLRISDATTSIANVTGIRIRWDGAGRLSIARFTSGSGVLLASLGAGGIVPPGPGAQLIGEAGVLEDGAKFFFRAKIGESIRLTATDATVPTGVANRRWGHGGRAEASVANAQTYPGGVHFWNGMDQVTS